MAGRSYQDRPARNSARTGRTRISCLPLAPDAARPSFAAVSSSNRDAPAAFSVRGHRGLELRRRLPPRRPCFLRVGRGEGLALLFSGGTFQLDQIFRDVDCHGRFVNGGTDIQKPAHEDGLPCR